MILAGQNVQEPKIPNYFRMSTRTRFMIQSIDHIRILTVGLELDCNRGSCGGIFSNANIFNDMSLDCKLVPVQP